MKWKSALLLGSTALTGAAVGVLVARGRAACQLGHDVEQLFAHATDVSAKVYHEAGLVGLPAPVQRYFRHVLTDGQPYLTGLRLRHNGQFRTSSAQDWVAISGEQYVTADPPGFIWQGTTSQFTARDEYVGGHGHLTVRLLGALPVVQGAGPSFDQGELLRWLGECAWLPTSLLPSRCLRWSPVDDNTADLALAHAGQAVTYRVRFNDWDEIEQCETRRYQSENVLLPWVGRFAEYREHAGVRVPTHLEASWVVDGQRQPYARFRVQELAYAPLQPFGTPYSPSHHQGRRLPASLNLTTACCSI